MRIFMMAAAAFFMSNIAVAQFPYEKLPPDLREPLQKATPAPVQQQNTAQIAEITPPEAGKHWKVFPTRVGRVSYKQRQEEINERIRVVGYLEKKNGLRVAIYNPSNRKSAAVRADCGESARLDSRFTGVQQIEKGEFRGFTVYEEGDFGFAQCSVMSDIPIIVAAFREETITKIGAGRNFSEYGTWPVQEVETPWPAFRLDGPN